MKEQKCPVLTGALLIVIFSAGVAGTAGVTGAAWAVPEAAGTIGAAWTVVEATGAAGMAGAGWETGTAGIDAVVEEELNHLDLAGPYSLLRGMDREIRELLPEWDPAAWAREGLQLDLSGMAGRLLRLLWGKWWPASTSWGSCLSWR